MVEGDAAPAAQWWGGQWACALKDVSFAVKDHQRRFVHVSIGFAERLDVRPSELIGLRDQDLDTMLPTDRERIRAEEDTAIATSAPVTATVRYRQRDGWTGHGVGVRFPVAGPAGHVGVGCLFLDVSEHVRARERFELFMNQSAALATIKDLDQRFVWVSRSTAARFRMPEEHILGRTPTELFGAEFGATSRTQDERMLAAGGDPVPFELALPLEPTRSTRLRGNRFTFIDGDGRTLIGAVFIDVTDEFEARRQAERAERRFTDFMQHSPAAAVMKDADGRYVWANPAYHRTYHIDPDGFIGKTIHDMTTREQAEYATDLDRRVMRTGAPLRDVHHYHRDDGTAGVDLGFRFPITTPDGRTGMGGVFIDITELHQTRAHAQEAQARYRELFEHAGIPIIVFDLKGRVIDANVAYTHLIGHSLSTLRGMRIDKLVTVATREKDTPRWMDLLAGRIRLYRSRATLRHAHGHIVAAIATQALITHPDGSPKFVYSVNAPVADADVEPGRRGTDVPQLADENLSHEERVILTTLAAGGTLSDVEQHLYLSRPGVNHHLTKLRARLGLPAGTRTGGLVARAYAHGLLLPGTWPPRTTC